MKLQTQTRSQQLLLGAGILSFAIALFQVVLSFSPSLTRLFGAAALAANPLLLLVAGLAVTILFALAGLYALAGACTIRRLPLLRTGLLVIGVIYTLRGLFLFPELLALAGVLHVPAQGVPKATPLILVHGGPGAFEVTASGAAYYGALTRDGFDVYLYDQIGSGHSARLANPWEYTVDRHVADLEAVRQQIGAERVVLLGESWGATLVANYMAVYPEHVARVIFTSPGVISPADWPGSLTPASRLPIDRQQQSNALFAHPRFHAWQILLQHNVQAAYQFIPEAELDGFADVWIASFVDGATCGPDPQAREDLSAGFGFWSMTMTNRDMSEREFDPHAALASNQTPALILRGECDYIPAPVAAAYKDTLPSATLAAVSGAGHLMYYEQSQWYLAAVRAFLLEQPLPIARHTITAPRRFQDGW